jgi:hypothetical protein
MLVISELGLQALCVFRALGIERGMLSLRLSDQRSGFLRLVGKLAKPLCTPSRVGYQSHDGEG